MAQPPPPNPTAVPMPVPMPVPITATTNTAAAAATPQPTSPTSLSQRTAVTPGAGALQEETLRTFLVRLDRRGQLFLDQIAPHKQYRWLFLISLLLLFLLRIVVIQGFYIVVYVLFIFILNQFILFLQPKDRASLVERAVSANSEGGVDDEGEGAPLPTMDDEEFRPFVRRLPEFKFWYSTTNATILSFWATFIPMFDIPVFWPVLLFYFIILFVTTMRRQWLDMKKLKYVPWDIGSKKVYKSDPKRLAVNRPGPVDVVAASGRAPPSAPVPMVNVMTKKPSQSPSDSASLMSQPTQSVQS